MSRPRPGLLAAVFAPWLLSVGLVSVSGPAAFADGAPTVSGVSPALGPMRGGTTVTVTGSGLMLPGGSGTTTVFFGATPATAVTCASTASCTATSPVGVGTVDITVTTSAGTSSPSPPDQFSYEQGWAIEDTIPLGQLDDSIACPSAEMCMTAGHSRVVGSAVGAATSNGGKTWVRQTMPPGNGGLNGVACPSVSVCYAAGMLSGIVVTTNGGRTWTSHPLPAGHYFILKSISCGDVSDCLAVGLVYPSGGVIVRTADGGNSWQTLDIPTGMLSLNSVSCVSAADCIAVGSGPSSEVALITTDGGDTWTSSSFTGQMDGAESISCPTSSDCLVVGDTHVSSPPLVEITTDGGQAWTTQPMPLWTGGLKYWLNGVSCASTTTCMAVGNTIANGHPNAVALSTTSFGRSWALRPASGTGRYLAAVGCPSTTQCFAVGVDDRYPSDPPSLMIATSDLGATWTMDKLPGGIQYLPSIACRSRLHCVAADWGAYYGDDYTTTNGGGTWQTHSSTATGGFVDIACPSVSDCWGAATDPTFNVPVLDHSTDGGSTWSPQKLPADLSSVDTVACANTSDCWAAGDSHGESAVIATTNGGRTWSESYNNVADPRDVLACPTASDCWLLGRSDTTHESTLVKSSDGGHAWTEESIPSGDYLYDIVCPTSLVCWAAGSGSGGGVIETTDAGATWSQASWNVPGTLYGIGCANTAICRAVGTQIDFASGSVVTTTNQGGTWANELLPSAVVDLFDVSCPTGTECWAVGYTSSDAVIVTTAPTIRTLSPSDGSVGSSVTINGINLSEATAVRFNGTPAPILSDSAIRIVASVPSGATSGSVSVVTPAGTAVSPSSFSVMP